MANNKIKSEVNSPIKSGWRGHINGHVEKTNGTKVSVGSITVTLDPETANSLCNLLHQDSLERAEQDGRIEVRQANALCNLGAAIGRLIDHDAANNCGRNIIK